VSLHAIHRRSRSRGDFSKVAGGCRSKDNLYPTKDGGKRRINWGWATVPPASAQTLPRHVTFNAAARCLQQYPIEELAALRGAPVTATAAGAVKLPAGAAKNSEIVATVRGPYRPGQ
jgi:hypothetical protein